MRRGHFTTAWVIAVGGVAGVLLSINAGLQLFVLQAHGRVSIATILLVLYLAAWSYVLGLVGLVLLSAWWISGRLRRKASRAAIGDASIEPRNRRLETRRQEGRQVFEDDVAAVIPNGCQDQQFVEATRTRTAI
jgi:hypothetical protein